TLFFSSVKQIMATTQKISVLSAKARILHWSGFYCRKKSSWRFFCSGTAIHLAASVKTNIASPDSARQYFLQQNNMPRPISARIHLEAISHNLSQARAHTPGAKTWSVVKANAYGHGIRHVYPALSQADGFALLDLEEAALLRELGWKGPVLLLEGVFEPADIAFCEAHDVWHTIHNEAQLRWMESRHTSHHHRIFLKINGG